jgi:hypothetical protein
MVACLNHGNSSKGRKSSSLSMSIQKPFATTAIAASWRSAS